ncbi:polyhomeotic-like protein 2 isoform X2 [Hetaerina americana]|uniref:polyhomeotic-like protein 2 isoform X2 n=1 Tax=Hetaerina americana TaxID=62018 RepID=UPI003A7F1A6E
MATMSAAAIQQTQMQQQQQQQQMAPPQAPTPQTLTHPHSAMHQVSEWGHGRVQVIQQPLQNPTYLQQIYNTQGQLLMPGNIALHPAGMNPAIQVIAAGKPFQPNQLAQHMITTQGKSVLQAGQAASFPGYATIPTTSNQTLVISQLGVLSSQPNILPAHAHGQGGKPGDMQKIMGGGGKSNVVSSNGMGGGGVGGGVGGTGGGVKGGNNQQQQQQQQQCVVSQPQLITTQAPTAAMLGNQAQLISPIQFPWQFGQLPSGITWATSGGLQSPAALLTTQNPIFIRGAQPHDPSGQGGQGPTATQGGVFIQSPPPQQVATHNPNLTGTPTGMQTSSNAASTGTQNQGNGNNQQHQAQQAQPQLTHQIHHQHHQLAMKVASVGTNAGRVGGMEASGTGNAGTGTTIQANIQPKTSVANTVLPPRLPNILRPASSVSTQTGSSGGPGGLGMGQLQMQKGIQGKVRIKPTMNRASPAPSMKADAANQTKPQPISPANMQHQTQQQQQLAAVAAQVSVSNRMILTSAPTNGAPLLPDKGQQLTLQAVKTFTSSSASTTSTTTSTSTSCSPAPTLPMTIGHPTAVLLPHPSLQAQLMGQAGCPPSPSGNANGPSVSVASPLRPMGAPTPSGIVTSMPVSMSLAAPPSSPSHQLHPSQVTNMQHQMMPSMVAMVAAAPSPNQAMQSVPGSSPPVSVVTSSTNMVQAGPVLSVVTGAPGGMVNNQVPAKEETGTSPQGDVGVGSVGDGGNSVMVVAEERRNGEASPAPGITPMEGVVETGIAPTQNAEAVNGEKEKVTNGVAEASVGNASISMESASTGEEGSGGKVESMPVGSSSLTNGPNAGTGTLTGMVVGTSRESHKLPPPKALVKPQVLTHVIEGFVIQEASEPFAVNRSSLLSEMAQPSLKANNQIMQNHTAQQPGSQEKENSQHHHVPNHVHVPPASNESEEPPKKKMMPDVQVPQPAKLPADLAKCEFCGKVDLRSKFKKSKRFCTLACAKSKRSGLYKPEESPTKKGTNTVSAVNAVPVGVNSVSPKELQVKQDWQKSKGQEWSGNQVPVKSDGSRLCPTNVTTQEENSHITDNETNDSSGAESSSMSPSEVGQGQESSSARTSGLATGDPADDNATSETGPLPSQQNATPSTPPQPRVNPIKWTVSDVCEFIRNLPGCSDYAEDFAIQEIDGQALLLLKEDHLMTAMSMKLGPALKICARIDTMRGDMKEK